MEITFEVTKEPKKTPCLIVPEDTLDKYIGTWTVHALIAKEGIEALDELIAENREYRENPDLITQAVFNKKMLEKGTTFNGKAIETIDLSTMPYKLWQLLTAANEKLNGISNKEADFLLQPFSAKKPPTIPQSH